MIDLETEEEPLISLDEPREPLISLSDPPNLPDPGGTDIITRTTGKPDLSACECDLPTLAVARGPVGPFSEQILYCSACEYRFCSVIQPDDEREDSNGGE